MTKVTIDRELLEQAISTSIHEVPERIKARSEIRAILAAPRQPEGALEVVGWHHSHAEVATSDKARVVTWLPECIEPLVRLSDHQRAIAELREQVIKAAEQAVRGAEILAILQAERDTLRQQLADRDAQIASMRAEVTPFIETHWMPVARQRDKLADLLDEVKSDLSAAMNWGDLDRIAARIDAALAEVGGKA